MKRILTELSPSDILMWAKNVAYPMVKDGTRSATSSVKRVVKTGQPKIRALKAEISKAMRKDPTVFGDVVRAGEVGRQITNVGLLQQLPPLPTPDTQSLQQVGTAVKGLLGNQKARHNMTNTAKKSLKNPLGTAKDFFVNRATASTYTGSPITNYNSSLFKIAGPVVDNGAMMVPLSSAGIDGQSLIDIAKSTKDYYFGGLRNAGQKIRQYNFFGK